jgi:hypothetical protein
MGCLWIPTARNPVNECIALFSPFEDGIDKQKLISQYDSLITRQSHRIMFRVPSHSEQSISARDNSPIRLDGEPPNDAFDGASLCR